ncbi:MAG: hypothetical protein QM778_16780 [Myxococcales bacterium]
MFPLLPPRARWHRIGQAPGWGLVALVWLALTASASRAQPRQVQLEWERPVASMCPSGETVQQDVEALLDERVFTDGPSAGGVMRGVVTEDEQGVNVQIEARSRSGELLGRRELAAPAGECASLRRPIALVLAVLFDQQATAQDGMRAPSAARGERWIGLTAAGSTAIMPRIAPSLGLTLGFATRSAWSVQADAGYWLPVTAQTAGGLGARFYAFGVGLSLCRRLARRAETLELALCGGAQAVPLFAKPIGLGTHTRQVRVLARAAVEVALSMRIGATSAIQGSLGPILSLWRPRFFLEQADGSTLEVHRPATVGAILRLTLIISEP